KDPRVETGRGDSYPGRGRREPALGAAYVRAPPEEVRGQARRDLGGRGRNGGLCRQIRGGRGGLAAGGDGERMDRLSRLYLQGGDHGGCRRDLGLGAGHVEIRGLP